VNVTDDGDVFLDVRGSFQGMRVRRLIYWVGDVSRTVVVLGGVGFEGLSVHIGNLAVGKNVIDVFAREVDTVVNSELGEVFEIVAKVAGMGVRLSKESPGCNMTVRPF
jgi:hypothetical protein